MKTKNILIGAVLALFTCGFVACSDDEDNNTTEPEEMVDEGEDQEGTDEVEEPVADDSSTFGIEGATDQEKLLINQQLAVTSILRTLAGIEEVDPHFDKQTYEPTVGEVLDEAQPYVRSVKCETVEAAELAFRGLAGCDELLKETSDGFSISLRDMPLFEDGTKVSLGTLTFHRGDGVREMGSVEVNIRCIPHLVRVEYLAPAAFPQNASSNSPYEVGDLVRYQGGDYCKGYYVCVRQPTNGRGGLLVHMCVNEPGGDETKNLDGDGDGCWYPYNRDKGMATEKEHVEQYIGFILNNKEKVANLKFYLDGKVKDRKPSLPGKKWHIFPEGFGNEDGYVFKSSDGRGARIRYEADYGSYAWVPPYHYRISFYWYVPCYSDNWDYVEAKTYEYVYDSDWDKHYGQCWNYTMNVITFGEKPVKSSEIEFSPTNKDVTYENDARFVTRSHLGWVYTSSNRLYETARKARAAGDNPIGIVAYVNDGSDFGNKVTEKDGENYGHGLVLARSNIFGNASLRWNPGGGLIAPIDYEFTQYVDKKTGAAAALTDFGGFDKTVALDFEGSAAAHAALNYGEPAPTPVTTKWFLPSAAQWIAILCKPGLGDMPMPSTTAGMPLYIESGNQAYNNINAYMKGTGFYTIGAASYWSSSTFNGYTGIYVAKDGGIRLTWYNSSKKVKVRPILAF